MDVRRIRAEMRMGRSIFDLPLRVTFYARVSTDKYEQQSSLENQVQYYTELIKSKRNWTYVEGYIDEGLSGVSTKKRDSFNRMISDAKAGRFDFIITKEISRFSRSTLDSIKYTQELLDCSVGVLFQNDNINTLDGDSEFRLVVMAGVAQDEVRKLSERLKFGFRQSIKNGRVLGNDKIWGYDKKDCKLTVNEDEAVPVRMIFELYANQGLGIRRISQALYERGYFSRKGNEFNVLTIRNILGNPKYKGWYCGNKTQSVDYRSKKNIFLEESEWVTYPDPKIPAIVSEQLWDRANELYRARSAQSKSHGSGIGFHSRYPYSGKIICGEHGAAFYRRMAGDREVWQCKVYRQKGRTACAAPQLGTCELDEIMARIFECVIGNKQVLADSLIVLIADAPDERGYARGCDKLIQELSLLTAKKERLLEMSVAGAVTISEFKARNDGFNTQADLLRVRLNDLQEQERKSREVVANTAAIADLLERKLNLDDGIDSRLAAVILDSITVESGSTREEAHLKIKLKAGSEWRADLQRQKSSFRLVSLRSTMPPPANRKI